MTGYESKRAAARDKLMPQSAPPQLLAHIKFLEDELLTVIADGHYSPYTTPPQRPWVGLTDKDRMQILDATEGDERGFVMKLVEDRLKGKNT